MRAGCPRRERSPRDPKFSGCVVLPGSWHPLRFLELHQEALEFRRVSVGIKDRRREQIGQRPRVLAFVLGDTAIALMNWETDLVGFLAIDLHGLDTLGDHCFRDVISSDDRAFYFFAAALTSVIRRLDGNFNE